jgi:multidrug efflux pump subunit AcrA (membrane-fusion protein)
VMVVGADNRAHQRPVKTGIREHDMAQIVEGLTAAEKVVTAGAYGLPDNSLVRTTVSPSQEQSGSRNQANQR